MPPPPGGREVPQLIEGSETYQSYPLLAPFCDAGAMRESAPESVWPPGPNFLDPPLRDISQNSSTFSLFYHSFSLFGNISGIDVISQEQQILLLRMA